MKDFPEHVYIGEKEKQEKHIEKEFEPFITTVENCILETLREADQDSKTGLRQYKIIELVKWKVPSSERQIMECLERLEEKNKIIQTSELAYKIQSES